MTWESVVNGLFCWKFTKNATSDVTASYTLNYGSGSGDGPGHSRTTASGSAACDDDTVRNMAIVRLTATQPIEIETDGPMWDTGTHVIVYGTGAADQWWRLTKTGERTATLDGSSGTTAGTGGWVTNRGMLFAHATVVMPAVDRGGFGDGHPATNGDDVACVVGWNGGPGKGTDCFYIGHNEPVFGNRPEWDQAIGIQTNCKYSGIDISTSRIESGIAIKLGPGHRLDRADAPYYEAPTTTTRVLKSGRADATNTRDVLAALITDLKAAGLVK